jgi:hypothetical protein
MHAEKNEGASTKKPNVPTYRKAGYGAGSIVADRGELAPVCLSSCVDVHIARHKKTSSTTSTRGTISSISDESGHTSRKTVLQPIYDIQNLLRSDSFGTGASANSGDVSKPKL